MKQKNISLLILIIAICACTKYNQNLTVRTKIDNITTNDSEKEDRTTITYEDPTLVYPILSEGGFKAATNLQSEVGCSEINPRKSFAKLSWIVAENPGTEQRIALTIFKDGFHKGNFQVSEPLSPNHTSIAWDQISGQAIHQWIVLTKHKDGWVPSETASFEGPLCIADMVNKKKKKKSFNKKKG